MSISSTVAFLLVALATATPAIAADKAEEATFPAALEQLQVGPEVFLAADGRGNVAAWDSEKRLIGLWDRHDRLVHRCVLEDPSLPSEGAGLALRGDTALLTFFDPAVESEGKRRQVVVNLRQCKVVGKFTMKGVTTWLAAAPDGWLEVTSGDELKSGRFSLAVLNDDGEVQESLDVERPLERLSKEKKFASRIGPRNIRPFAVGNDIWVIPAAVYELWSPPQHGKSLREVSPPDCLAAKARELTGEENVKHVLELSRHWPENIRKSLELGAKQGGLSPSFLAATSNIATWDRFVAVQVRDWKTGGGERVDVWDMFTVSVVALVPLPNHARLVAFTDLGFWVRVEGGRLEQLPLPDLWPERFNPCTALEKIMMRAQPPAEPPRTPPAPSAGPAWEGPGM